MSTSRDRRARTPVDLDPEAPAGPAGQHALTERAHQQRWIMRLDHQGHVVSHGLEGGPPAGARRALIDRPHQEEAWARRGDPCGRDVVARRGERRYRDHWSSTTLRGQRARDSTRARSRPEVAGLGAVGLAWVTTGARQDQALLEP